MEPHIIVLGPEAGETGTDDGEGSEHDPVSNDWLELWNLQYDDPKMSFSCCSYL